MINSFKNSQKSNAVIISDDEIEEVEADESNEESDTEEVAGRQVDKVSTSIHYHYF